MNDPSSNQSQTGFIDVQMRGFRHRTPLGEALLQIDQRISIGKAESAHLENVAGRVLAENIASSVDIPGFPRAAMDGYAISAGDTLPASPETPVQLSIVGESWPGRACPISVVSGQAIQIMTGAPAPVGADAVLPVEQVDLLGSSIRVTSPISSGKNISSIGEDVTKGQIVLRAGRRLRPQDIGLLASIGAGDVQVYAAPLVAVLVTGNELLPPGTKPEGYRMVDSNSIMLAGLVRRDGGVSAPVVYLPDDPDRIGEALRNSQADVILICGGSSVGKEDFVPKLVAQLGELLVHGIAIRPGGPGGFGFVNNKPVFLLPGNPVACLVAYDLLASRAIRRMGGMPTALPYSSLDIPLASPIHSAAGRVDYVRVRVTANGAEPIPGSGGSRLSTTVEADGFMLVEAEREGLQVGEIVRVYRYDVP